MKTIAATAVLLAAFGFSSQVRTGGNVSQRVEPPKIPAELSALRGRPIRKNPKTFTAIQMYNVKAAKVNFDAYTKPDVDLRTTIANFDIDIRDQGSRGTCSVHAMTFLIEYTYRKHGINPAPAGLLTSSQSNLSEEYLNHLTNVELGSFGDGDFFSNLAIGYAKYGIVTETMWPYKAAYSAGQQVPGFMIATAKKIPKFQPAFIKEWDVSTGATDAQIATVCKALDAKHPVAAGLRWPKSGKWKTENVANVEMMAPPAASDVFDGHSIAFVGYKKHSAFPGGGYFIFRNSGGAGWWDSGHGYMSFAYVKAFCNDLFVFI